MSDLYHLLIRGALSLFLLAGCLSSATLAEDNPAALDPSDVFFQAYLTVRDAEKLEETGKHSDAWSKYRQAARYYDLLAKYHKNWKPHLVQGRIESTRESIKAIDQIGQINHLHLRPVFFCERKQTLGQASSSLTRSLNVLNKGIHQLWRIKVYQIL